MPEAFNCPNCGAPLDYKGNDPIIRCPYCSTSVVVPENLKSKPSFSSQPSNFTLNGMGDMGALIQKARRIKDVKDLAQSGRTEQAISLYREITDSSHHDAEIAVQSLAQGRAITLSNFSAADVSAQVRQYTLPPQIQVQTPVAQRSNRAGCVIGCISILFALGIISAVLLSVFSSSLPMLLGSENMPEALQTALPEIATTLPKISTEMPQILPTVHHFASEELSFGGEGTGPGLFTDPRAIAVDPASGNIYVADYQGGRVQMFDTSGKFVSQWQVGDKKTIIRSMTADHKGNVFVVSTKVIYRYNSATGEELGQIKANASVGFLYDSIIAAADGTLYAISGGENIVHLDINGKILSSIPKAISTITDDSELDAKIAVDGEGNIYLLGSFNDAVFKFGPKGKYINKFGSDGDKPGQFRAPGAIAVDGQGNIYVSDFKGIQVFDKDGQYVDVINIKGACFGMAFDDQGKLYITTNVSKILKFAISK